MGADYMFNPPPSSGPTFRELRWQAACKAFGTWMMDESFYDSDGKYLERVLPVLKAMQTGNLEALEAALGIKED
jgi:hypothetical protein